MGKEMVKKESRELANGTLPKIIQLAVEKGDLDKIEKLLVLQERWEANEAKKAYNKAMADFKANPPKISKDKKVSFGQGKTAYNHASLYNVTDKINSELSKHGLSASWTTKQNGAIIVTCKITHVKGHSEETSLSAQADTSGSKNSIQAIGSTITYLERYTLLALAGLATFDQDDDGKSVSAERIDEKQLSELLDLINTTDGLTSGKVSKAFGIATLEELPKAKYTIAIERVKNFKVKK